ncbi:MAG: ribonuclease P protein component [Agriterribacter sp.]
MKKTFTLNKAERLKSRKRIEQLFREGESFFLYPYKVQFQIQPAAQTTSLLQAGVSASTRNFKKAVDRNRIKRLTREAYRLQKFPLQQKLTEQKKEMILFLIYVGKELPDFMQVQEKLGLILLRLIHKADEKNTQHT